MNKTADTILKDFLDEVDYTLEVETPGVGDKEFYDRPYTQCKQALLNDMLEIVGEDAQGVQLVEPEDYRSDEWEQVGYNDAKAELRQKLHQYFSQDNQEGKT